MSTNLQDEVHRLSNLSRVANTDKNTEKWLRHCLGYDGKMRFLQIDGYGDTNYLNHKYLSNDNNEGLIRRIIFWLSLCGLRGGDIYSQSKPIFKPPHQINKPWNSAYQQHKSRLTNLQENRSSNPQENRS
ncbi:5143_t:CDS:2, partial [Scutellospora calospora]